MPFISYAPKKNSTFLGSGRIMKQNALYEDFKTGPEHQKEEVKYRWGEYRHAQVELLSRCHTVSE